MSELPVTIQDTQRDGLPGRAHGSDVERLVAALAAEPETIEELHTAAQRFYPPGGHSPIAWSMPGVDVEPYDAGACVIDLAARYVAYESTYSSFGREGVVDYIDHARGISLGLPYHLSEDWLVRSSLDSWEADADGPDRRRQAAPRMDARRCSTCDSPISLSKSVWRHEKRSDRMATGRRRKVGLYPSICPNASSRTRCRRPTTRLPKSTPAG